MPPWRQGHLTNTPKEDEFDLGTRKLMVDNNNIVPRDAAMHGLFPSTIKHGKSKPIITVPFLNKKFSFSFSLSMIVPA